MDLIINFTQTLLSQLQSPTLAFLIGGMAISAFGSKLEIPDAIYRFIVFMLLMKIGLKAGIEIRQAELSALVLPAIIAATVGCLIVIIGRFTLVYLPNIRASDAIATAGVFGAVSASTMAAAMIVLEEQGIFYEAWVPALYPFMDIPALILAIVLAGIHKQRSEATHHQKIEVRRIITDSLKGSAVSALLLGMAIGLLSTPDRVVASFYEPLFRGLLSVLMLIMGMEAYTRLAELRKVAQWYAVYAIVGPILHGSIAFGLGTLAHVYAGFSPGGVILLAVIAASSSDISGPPTLRAGIPSANPAAFIGSSTSIGTPMAIAVCIPLFIAVAEVVFDI